MKQRKKQTDAVEILQKRYIRTKKQLEALEKEREKAGIAEQIYFLRTQAGMTQAQLAKKIGTTQSVISRLEDADYDGHTLTILRRIATALNQKVEIRIVPDESNLAIT